MLWGHAAMLGDMNSNPQVPSKAPSFGGQVGVELADLRLWFVVLTALALGAVVFEILPLGVATVLSFPIMLLAGHLIQRIDKLPVVTGAQTLGNVYHTIVPALSGVVVVQGAEIFARVWFMPWYWFHRFSDVPSCSFLLSGAALGWCGLLISGALLGVLTGRRATFAAMIGVATYIPLELTDAFTGTLAQKAPSLLSSCKFFEAPTDAGDLEAFQHGVSWGMATATITGALLIILSARVVSSWVANREPGTGLNS
jgi:hypothetical protein